MQVVVMGRVSPEYQSIEDKAAPPLQSTSTPRPLAQNTRKVAQNVRLFSQSGSSGFWAALGVGGYQFDAL